MKCKIAYRIELRDGEGPYAAENEGRRGVYGKDYGIVKILKSHCDGTLHPSPWMPGEPFAKYFPEQDPQTAIPPQDLECGFSDLDQLHAWFPTDLLDRLFKIGFWLRKYEVNPNGFYQGARQVVFNIDLSEMVTEINDVSKIDSLK